MPTAQSRSQVLRRSRLLEWSDTEGAEYPWRGSNDAWHVLLSEVMLRRTRARQAEPVINSIFVKYPRPRLLAAAGSSDLLPLIRPAGLVRRAEELIRVAKIISDDFDGQTPVSVEDLQLLPGVGPYVAAAVVAGVTGTEVILIDTNTIRVARRVIGVEIQGHDIRRQRVVVDAVDELFGGPATAELWWATIDLAHSICTPRSPLCDCCPISELCVHTVEAPECRTPEVRSRS